jgi:quercetin dioxygenase-like cupin family protein
MMHQGHLNYVWEGGELEMQAGDVLTAPIGLPRQYVSGDDEAAIAYVVRGGDSPGGFVSVSNCSGR